MAISSVRRRKKGKTKEQARRDGSILINPGRYENARSEEPPSFVDAVEMPEPPEEFNDLERAAYAYALKIWPWVREADYPLLVQYARLAPVVFYQPIDRLKGTTINAYTRIVSLLGGAPSTRPEFVGNRDPASPDYDPELSKTAQKYSDKL